MQSAISLVQLLGGHSTRMAIRFDLTPPRYKRIIV